MQSWRARRFVLVAASYIYIITILHWLENSLIDALTLTSVKSSESILYSLLTALQVYLNVSQHAMCCSDGPAKLLFLIVVHWCQTSVRLFQSGNKMSH